MEAKTLSADVSIFGHLERLSPGAVHSAYCRFDSRVKWWIYVLSIVIFMQKLLFVALKQLQTTFWIIDTLFLIDCEQTQHPLWRQLSHWQMFMQNCEYTAFSYRQLLCYLMQLQFMSLWRFLVFSGTTVEFGQPEHSVSFVSVQPCLKSAYHFLTIISDGAESEYDLSSHCFMWTAYFLIRKQCFINIQNSDFSIILKICNSSFT